MSPSEKEDAMADECEELDPRSDEAYKRAHLVGNYLLAKWEEAQLRELGDDIIRRIFELRTR